jgi:replication-associated recombination protein RarA
MIDLSLPLIGPAVELLPTLQQLPIRNRKVAVLLHGDPGTGKSHLLDLFANNLTGSKWAIEHVNGQSVSVELVRQWRERGAYGNLFSKWTVKRIDEFDRASDAAQAELLTWLDYLPEHYVVAATTNNYRGICRADAGRLQSRFKQWEVKGPSAEEAAQYLRDQLGLPTKAATTIANGAKTSNDLFARVNMRAAVEDAQAFLAVREAKKAA